jgi:riboflavin kinase/FMN adenylyltransferase
MGITTLFEISPTTEFLEQSPQQFFNFFLKQKLAAQGIVEGDNFRFGHHRVGDIALLHELSKKGGINLEIIKPIMHEGYVISSTAIRQALLIGDIETANTFLGRPYSITGNVVIGEQRGRTLGFPTANLAEIETLIPGSGVYQGRVTLNNKTLMAAIHLGENLTFQGQTKKVEVHIIEFSGDLYGQQLTVDFLQKIRDIRKFSGKEELLQQIRLDIQSIVDTDDNDPNASFLSLDITKLRNQLENS